MKEYQAFATAKYALAIAAEQGADSYRLARKGPGESGKPAWGPIFSITETVQVSPVDGEGPIKIRLLKEEEPIFQDIYVLANAEDTPREIPRLKPPVVKQQQQMAKKKPPVKKEHQASKEPPAAEETEQDVASNGHGTNGHGHGTKPPGLGTLIQEALALAASLSVKTAQLAEEQSRVCAEQMRLNELLQAVRERSPVLVELLS